MNFKYKCVIFDVDGTMIDNEKIIFDMYQKVIYEEFGRYFTEEEFSVAYGIPTGEAMEKLGFKDIDFANEKYHMYLMEAFKKAKPFDGITEVLEQLNKNKIKTAIVTSRDKDEVANDACLQGLIKYFNNVVCSSDTIKHKPEAEPLLKAVELAECNTNDALYIGDTYYDYMCAKNAGVDFGLALWGTKDKDRIDAKYNLEKAKDILDCI